VSLAIPYSNLSSAPVALATLEYAPPAATRYVSQSATNGYAVGANSGAGSSKGAPWLTLTYAIANAADGDVIYLNDGDYRSASAYTIGKSLTIVAETMHGAALKATGAQTYIALLSAATDKSIAFYRCVFDGESTAGLGVRIGSSSLTSQIDGAFYNCRFKDNAVGPFLSNSQKKTNITFRNCEADGTWSGNVLFDVRVHELGAIVVDGLTVNGACTGTSSKRIMSVVSAAAGTTARISNVAGTVTADDAAFIYGVLAQNFPDCTIENCNIAMPSGTSGALYAVQCTSATLNANGAIIRHNRGHGGYDGGYLIQVGQDSSSAGDGRQNDSQIYDNVLTANAGASTPIHGLMLGYGTGGDVRDNTVTGAGLALLAKQQTGGAFYRNTVAECTSEAIRAKGANGTVWHDNTVTLSPGFAGDCVAVDANDTTDSTGVEITGNVFNVGAAPALIVGVDAGSDATFSANTYAVGVTLGAGAWSYQGTAYDTLAAWKAAHEPDALP
jgi:hypothetical protein